jgi:hypothetical protein
MDHAALPFCLRIELGQVLDQAQALVGNEQLDALQPALFELAQECCPTGNVFLGPFAPSQNLPVAGLRHTNLPPGRNPALAAKIPRRMVSP